MLPFLNIGYSNKRPMMHILYVTLWSMDTNIKVKVYTYTDSKGWPWSHRKPSYRPRIVGIPGQTDPGTCIQTYTVRSLRSALNSRNILNNLWGVPPWRLGLRHRMHAGWLKMEQELYSFTSLTHRHFISQSIHLARMDTWINFGSNGDAWFDNWVVNAGFTGSDKYGSVVEAGDVQGPAWLPGVRVISVREPVAWWDTFPTWLTSRLSGWTQLVLDVVTCKQGNERWAGVVYESALRLRYQHGVSVLTVFQKKSNANLSV